MGRADVIAQGLIQLHGEEHLDIVARAMGSMQSREAVEATVQVSLVLASSTRSDVMTKVSLSVTAVLGTCSKNASLPGMSQQGL